MVVLDPVPAYVVKTLDVAKNEKVFINVCTDPQVSAPDSLDPSDIAVQVTQGHDWIVPIVVSIVRQDMDKKGSPSLVVDCCVNPQVVLVGIEDPSVKVLTVETCIESVEDRHGIVLSRDYKFPRMKAKNQLVKTEFDPDQPKELYNDDMIVEEIQGKTAAPELEGAIETKQAKEIEVLGSEETVFYLHMYRGPYSGPLPRPSHIVEVEGEQREIQLNDKTLVLGNSKLELPFKPSKYHAYFDGATYILLWNRD